MPPSQVTDGLPQDVQPKVHRMGTQREWTGLGLPSTRACWSALPELSTGVGVVHTEDQFRGPKRLRSGAEGLPRNFTCGECARRPRGQTRSEGSDSFRPQLLQEHRSSSEVHAGYLPEAARQISVGILTPVISLPNVMTVYLP